MTAAACGLVALESSTHVTPSRSPTTAIRCASGRNPRSPSRTAAWLTPWARASAAAASALATTWGAGPAAPGGARSASVHSSAALVSRCSMKARSTRMSSTTPTIPTAGRAQGEADRAGALDDVGLADQLLGDRVRHVVDAGAAHPLVDPALVGGVGLHAGRPVVPVQVVLRDVEHRRRLGTQRVGVVELEAGELDRQHVVRRRVHHRLHDREPDVAGGLAAQAGGAEDPVEHLNGRGLAVGAGDAEPGGVVVGVAQPPRQLDLSPDGNAALPRLHQDRRVRSEAGRHDEQVDVVGQRGGRPGVQVNCGAEDLQELRLLQLRRVSVIGEGGDRGTHMGQVVGRGEPGDTEAGDHGADAIPRVVPAELARIGHSLATHSA